MMNLEDSTYFMMETRIEPNSALCFTKVLPSVTIVLKFVTVVLIFSGKP